MMINNAVHEHPISPLTDFFLLDESEIKCDVLLRTREKWEQLRNGRPIPSWTTDYLLEIEHSLAPYVAVKTRSEETYQYLFWGSGLTHIYGNDFTGKTIDSIRCINKSKTAYDQVFDTGNVAYLILRHKTQYEINSEQLCLLLLLPFGTENSVTHILSVSLFQGMDAAAKWNDVALSSLWAQQAPSNIQVAR